MAEDGHLPQGQPSPRRGRAQGGLLCVRMCTSDSSLSREALQGHRGERGGCSSHTHRSAKGREDHSPPQIPFLRRVGIPAPLLGEGVLKRTPRSTFHGAPFRVGIASGLTVACKAYRTCSPRPVRAVSEPFPSFSARCSSSPPPPTWACALAVPLPGRLSGSHLTLQVCSHATLPSSPREVPPELPFVPCPAYPPSPQLAYSRFTCLAAACLPYTPTLLPIPVTSLGSRDSLFTAVSPVPRRELHEYMTGV